MKKKILQAGFLALLIVSIFLPVSKVQASIFSRAAGIMSPVAAMNMILADLGVDKGELMGNIDTMNVARRKKPPPTVTIMFNPPNPMVGEKVTATAYPVYFMNANPTDNYYTWLLQRGGEGDDANDMKIAAALIIGNGGWDWNRIPLPPAINPDDHAPYTTGETDDDGYEAVNGGDDQRGKPAMCFVRDFTSGDDFEIPCFHLFPEPPDGPECVGDTGELGDGEYHFDEEWCWRTDPNNNDTAGTTRMDEANVLGQGINEFTWTFTEGDKVSLAVEGIAMDPTIEADTSYKTMWAINGEGCDITDLIGEWEYELGEGCELNVPCALPATSAVTTATATVAANVGIGDTAITVSGVTAADWANTTLIRVSGDSPTVGGEVMNFLGMAVDTVMSVSRLVGAITHTSGAAIYGNTTTVITEITRTVTLIAVTNEVSVCDDTTTTTIVTDVLEAEISNESVTETVCETHAAREFDAGEVEDYLNECLVNNLVAPSDVQEEGAKLKLSITYSPQSPVNDPRDITLPINMSDTLELSAAVENVTNDDFLRYDWDVYLGGPDAITDDIWGPQLVAADLTESTPTSGIGVKKISFKVNFGDLNGEPPSFLKVKATATEYDQKGHLVMRKGNTSEVIPLSNASDTFSAHIGIASAEGLVSLGTEICSFASVNPLGAQENILCPVIKNQIIGVSYAGDADQFQWTLDGNPMVYSQQFFEGQNMNEQTDTAFFPVLKEPGSTYTVRVSAVARDDGRKISLVRTFKVVDPIVYIENEANQILLGEYIPNNGEDPEEDFSDTTFEATQGDTATFTLRLYPIGTEVTGTTWFVDGTDPADPASPPGMTPATVNGNSVSVPVSKLPGDSYNISLSTLYVPDVNIKRVLNRVWQVNFNEIYDAPLSTTVTLNVAMPVTTGGKTVPKKFMAAIFSGLPSYISFLFRIVLTASLLLLGAHIIFSFMPSPIEKNNKSDE